MSRAIWLRRAVVTTLILTALPTVLPITQALARVTRDTRYTYTSSKICPIDWRDGAFQVKQLIRCTAGYYGVDEDKALYVAKRESGFDPEAFNSWSCAKGIFQHLCKYWPDRAFAYGFKDWSAYNARANIIVTMKMVRRYGWAPWS